MKKYNSEKSLNDISYHVANLAKKLDDLNHILDEGLHNINQSIQHAKEKDS